MEHVLLRRPRRTRKPFLMLCMASPLLLCLGWSALWLFARREVASVMDGLIDREAGHGRQWHCGNRRITGFPLELRLSCTNPSLHGAIGGGLVTISAAGLDVHAALYRPNAIEASMTGPLEFERAGPEGPARVTFTALTVQARLMPDERGRIAILVEAPALKDGQRTGKAAHFEVHAAPAPGSAPQDRAYEVWCKLDEALVPAVNAATGGEEPFSIDQRGVLKPVDLPAGEPWPVLVEAWREGGGTYALSSLSANQGLLKVDAKGTLALDGAHRVAGRLQAAIQGYEPLAARFGISPGALSMGNALSRLLTHGAGASPAGEASIKVPVSFADGRVSVGPIVTPLRLAPLY